MTGAQLVLLIEKRLKEMGIKKGKFYSDTGISSSTMSQWRRGEYVPSSGSIKVLNDYLGLNLTLTEKPANADGLSDEEEEIVRLYRSADPKTQAIIQTVLKADTEGA